MSFLSLIESLHIVACVVLLIFNCEKFQIQPPCVSHKHFSSWITFSGVLFPEPSPPPLYGKFETRESAGKVLNKTLEGESDESSRENVARACLSDSWLKGKIRSKWIFNGGVNAIFTNELMMSSYHRYVIHSISCNFNGVDIKSNLIRWNLRLPRM